MCKSCVCYKYSYNIIILESGVHLTRMIRIICRFCSIQIRSHFYVYSKHKIKFYNENFNRGTKEEENESKNSKQFFFA